MSDKVMPLYEVLEQLRVKKGTFYNLIKKGLFPKPLKISRRLSVWRQSDVDKYIEECSRKREDK